MPLRVVLTRAANASPEVSGELFVGIYGDAGCEVELGDDDGVEQYGPVGYMSFTL